MRKQRMTNDATRHVPLFQNLAASGAGSGAARVDSGAEMAKNRSGPAKILIHQVLVLI